MSTLVSFDSETSLIRPGCTAPPMACQTWQLEGQAPGILHARDSFDQFRDWVRDPSVILTGANTAFDMAVAGAQWPELVDSIFAAYEASRVTDVQIRQKLIDIADGRFQFDPRIGAKPKYSLEDVGRRYGIRLDKPVMVLDPVSGKKVPDPLHCRLRFGELTPHSVEEWDELALKLGFRGPPPTAYAIEDATATLTCHLEQGHCDALELEYEMARRGWVLYLASAWGLRTDPALVAKLEQRAAAERDRMGMQLQEAGFVRKDGTRNTKLAATYMRDICRREGLTIPLTATGQDRDKIAGMSVEEIEDKYTSLSEDACDMTGDPLLELYADYTRLGTVINKDCKALKQGTVYPIHTRYDIVATGRTSSSKPNCQNWGRNVGPRECFVPRPGYVFVQADYEQLELRTLAQVCIALFGVSILAEQLNKGIDPHTAMAAKMLGISYDDCKKRVKAKEPPAYNARQAAKVANFGFPGGLGPDKLVVWARATYDVQLESRCAAGLRCPPSQPCARHLKELWFGGLPEMPLYFEYMNRQCANPSRTADIVVPLSGWRRGGATYCAACNTPFQSLGAAAAGRGVWHLAKACYVDRDSVLFGSRNVLHVHDENIGEVRDDSLAHDKAMEWSRLMEAGANELLPDVPVTAPPLLMRYWSKNAFALKGPDGRLQPWNGEKAE